MERVMGIEPTSSAWKAEVLPLNYARGNWPRPWNRSGGSDAMGLNIVQHDGRRLNRFV